MSTTTDTEYPVPAAPARNGDDDQLKRLLAAVTDIDCNASDEVLLDPIAALERFTSGCAAAQARLTATAAFTDSVTADAATGHHRMDAVRRSIAGQTGLACRDSPFAGRRHVGVAGALVNDLPHALAALARGDLSERRARIVMEQLACLTPDRSAGGRSAPRPRPARAERPDRRTRASSPRPRSGKPDPKARAPLPRTGWFCAVRSVEAGRLHGAGGPSRSLERE